MASDLEMQAELNEQARLNGMGAEREAALMAKVDVLERELAALRQQIADAEVVGWAYKNGTVMLTVPPFYGKLYTTPQPCPKCAKAVEALKEYKRREECEGFYQSVAREALAELEK